MFGYAAVLSMAALSLLLAGDGLTRSLLASLSRAEAS